MKRYLRVTWHHDLAEEPVLIFSDIDAGVETRKVEAYRDGRMDCADENSASGTTQLSGRYACGSDGGAEDLVRCVSGTLGAWEA